MKKILPILLLFCFTQTKAQSCLPYKITSSANGYNLGDFSTAQQSALSYNADLNAILFTAPVSPYWHYTNKTDNDIQVNWYNLNTLLWDSAIIYHDSSNNKQAAFCGAAIYNPLGNTNINNSFITTTGPWQNNNGTWQGVFYNSIKPQHQYIAGNDSNLHTLNNLPFGSSTFLNADIQQAGNKIIVAGVLNNPNNTTKSTVRGGVIAKADFSSGKAVWTTDTIKPPFYNNTTKGYMANDFRLAFAPDGLTGYAVFVGNASHNIPDSGSFCYFNPPGAMAPVVYKTINGGQSWAFTSIKGWYMHPECLKNLTYPTSTYTNSLDLYTLFYSPYGAEHGIDLTVDANGVLHLVSVVGVVPYNNSYPDSLMSISYNTQWDYINYHPIIWDFTTNGSTAWQTMMVDSIMSSPTGINPLVDTTAAFGKWKGKTVNYFGQGARIQISRSADGKIIFYTWADTDPNLNPGIFNISPDILIKAIDVTQNLTTNTKNATNDLGTCYFHSTSNIAIGTYTAGSWQVPLTWQNGQVQNTALVYDGTQPVDYYYDPCATFSAADFINPALINPYVYPICDGIQQIKNNTLKIYPNPANNKITVDATDVIDVKLFDVLGKQITVTKTNNVDVSDLNDGVYFIQVQTKQNTTTQKIIVQH